MTIQPGANVYTQGFGSRPENVEVPVFSPVGPAPSNANYPLGKRWINTVANTEYSLTSFNTSQGVVTATWTLLGAGAGDLNTLTTDDLTIVTPTAGNINLAGGGSLATTGSGSTATVALTGLTTHNVLVGAGTATITKVAPSATVGVALVSAGAAVDPAFGTVVVAGGGTGAVTLTGIVTGNGTSAMTANAVTQHGVLIGGASNAASSLGVAATGTLLAGATGADPAFTASPSVTGSITAGTTLTATLGAITATNGNLVLGTAGNKILSTSVASTTTAGANSFGTVTLSSGTATVATSAVTANSIIFLTRTGVGASSALGELTIASISANTNFVINAATVGTPGTPLATDASVVGWMIVN
jgi:hypothetical protein